MILFPHVYNSRKLQFYRNPIFIKISQIRLKPKKKSRLLNPLKCVLIRKLVLNSFVSLRLNLTCAPYINYSLINVRSPLLSYIRKSDKCIIMHIHKIKKITCMYFFIYRKLTAAGSLNSAWIRSNNDIYVGEFHLCKLILLVFECTIVFFFIYLQDKNLWCFFLLLYTLFLRFSSPQLGIQKSYNIYRIV